MKTQTANLIPTCRFAAAGETGGVLCHCTGVKEAAVHELVQAGSVESVQEVMHQTGAGTGCGACRCRINRVLDGLPAACGGRFDLCGGCGCVSAICQCEAA
ncbi:MAG: (2Fe-2S)-binding protein [Verrucomicrobiales bacterium]|nr:(2Fe-2S)-binding protein [Verrucomicrobiales bacterium]